MVNFDGLALGPAYSLFGVDATLMIPAQSASAVRVIDHTAGVVVHTDDPGGAGAVAVRPAVHIRTTDLAGFEPKGGTIVIGGVTWDIDTSLPVIGPAGVGTGEHQLFLSEP